MFTLKQKIFAAVLVIVVPSLIFWVAMQERWKGDDRPIDALVTYETEDGEQQVLLDKWRVCEQRHKGDAKITAGPGWGLNPYSGEYSFGTLRARTERENLGTTKYLHGFTHDGKEVIIYGSYTLEQVQEGE